MKILIAADIEGISGVTNWDQADPTYAEYARFRKIMTDEVNAAVRGAFDGGADEVTVTDGHADGNNILIEALDPRAPLNSGHLSPFSMVCGHFDAAVIMIAGDQTAMPDVRRLDGKRIEITVEDMPAAYDAFRAAASLVRS